MPDRATAALDDTLTQLGALRGILTRATSDHGGYNSDTPQEALEQARRLAVATSDTLRDAILVIRDLLTPESRIAVSPDDHGRALELATAYVDGVAHGDEFALLSGLLDDPHVSGPHDAVRTIAALTRLTGELALDRTGSVDGALAALRAATRVRA